MALDVYVGSLTRYYTGDWQSVGEQTARLPPAGRRGDAEETRAAVLAWRETLAASLGANVTVALEWDESPRAPYFTGRPGWDGFGSLVLWAAYAEHPGMPRPASLPEEWDDDAALLRCNAEGFRSRFSHLVRNVELWLPAPLQFTFEGEDVDGRRLVMGSAETLARQLADLNTATWKVKPAEVAGWGLRPPPVDASLETGARYAFAVLSDLTACAVEHRLPMKLDF